MARKEAHIRIDAPGRDNGKMFVLREMPASQAERWAMRALLALTNSGAELPDDVEGAGMAGLAMMGLQALTMLRFEDVEPLMIEMFACVQACPDPTKPEIVRSLIEDDIEEVGTRLRLRKELVELHVGFSLSGARSTPSSPTPSTPDPSRITRTSPAR